MDKCLICEIHAKLICCCNCHPETKAQINLILKNKEVVKACPNLNSEGLCKIHNSKDYPDLCKEFRECSYNQPANNATPTKKSNIPAIK